MNKTTTKTRIVIFITVLALMFFSVMFLSAGTCNIYFETTSCGQEICICDSSSEVIYCDECNQEYCICEAETSPHGRFLNFLDVDCFEKNLTREDAKHIAYHNMGKVNGAIRTERGFDFYEIDFTPTLEALPPLCSILENKIIEDFRYMLNSQRPQMGDRAGEILVKYLGTYNSVVVTIITANQPYISVLGMCLLFNVVLRIGNSGPIVQFWMPN
ncbi:MAG: hypothetical protein FWE13_05250 [Firmicutes bacterium]|nr:hypothetical protein [Bacillota bacterium]